VREAERDRQAAIFGTLKLHIVGLVKDTAIEDDNTIAFWPSCTED
jgi:hypothetical protein